MVEGNTEPEYIINKASNFNSKLEYYKKAYNDNMQLIANNSITIVDIIVGNRLSLTIL